MMNNLSSAHRELHSIRDVLRFAVSRFRQAGLFFGHGTDNAWDEALILVHHVLSLPPEGDARFLDARLLVEEKKQILDLINRRVSERIPLPYLIGEAWFAGLPFAVDERVLIPRSPIAELIEQSFQPWLQQEPASVLDLCTGSGCIGIACAYAFPQARVDLSDISRDALEVANINIRRHHLGDRVRSIHSDLFENLAQNQYDLIVSNPPYVDAVDMESRPDEFYHEPELALASGIDGLNFTRRLLAEAPSHLTDDGVLIVEVGNSRRALEENFPHLPFVWIEFSRGGEGVFLLRRRDFVPGGEIG